MGELTNIDVITNIKDFNIDIDRFPLLGLRCPICNKAKEDRLFNEFVHVQSVRDLLSAYKLRDRLEQRFNFITTPYNIRDHYLKHLDKDLVWIYADKKKLREYILSRSKKYPVVVKNVNEGDIKKEGELKKSLVMKQVGQDKEIDKEIESIRQRGLDEVSLIKSMELLYLDLREKYLKFDKSQNGVMTEENIYYYEKIVSELRMILSELNKIQQSQKIVKGVIELIFGELSKVIAKEVVNLLIEEGVSEDKMVRFKTGLISVLSQSVDLVMKDISKTYRIN